MVQQARSDSQPYIIFLTDGEPSVSNWQADESEIGVLYEDALLQRVEKINVPLYAGRLWWEGACQSPSGNVKEGQTLLQQMSDRAPSGQARCIDGAAQFVALEAEHERRMMEERHRNELLRMRIDFYSEMLQKGRFYQLALSIADDNEKAAKVVDALETQRDKTINELWKLFKTWLDSDDAPLIADRVNDLLQGIGVATSLLGGNNNPVLPQPSEPASNVLIEPSDGEDWSELIETIREEQMDESDEDDRSPKKKRDPEDAFL